MEDACVFGGGGGSDENIMQINKHEEKETKSVIKAERVVGRSKLKLISVPVGKIDGVCLCV